MMKVGAGGTCWQDRLGLDRAGIEPLFAGDEYSHRSLARRRAARARVITAALLDEFDDAVRGKQAAHRKAGRVLKLIGHSRAGLANRSSIHILAIVNHRELADKDRYWRRAAARLRKDMQIGAMRRMVFLDVVCLQDLNRSLASGEPHFASIARDGLTLYEVDRTPLATPGNLSASERYWRGQAEFERWYPRAEDFLSGATFYREQGNFRMAALLLHQACEHLYQCLSWSHTLHGRRTHDLDELRTLAEGLCDTLPMIWPSTSRFERRCFALLRRAYVDARYEARFAVSEAEIEWALGRAMMLYRRVGKLCREHLAKLLSSSIDLYDQSGFPWPTPKASMPAELVQLP